MRVALDLEEVLADTIEEATRSTDKLDEGDFDSWDLEGYVWQVYMGVSDALWRHDPLSIPPVEDALDEKVASVRSSVDELDIVTARLHVNDGIERWLTHHGIEYDDLLTPDVPKYELEYDVYIDDNPDMVGECRLFLRDHPHNEHVDCNSYKSCDRIGSMGDAPAFL